MAAKGRKKRAAGSNVPDWMVTFADLMSVLVCFFVLIVSFSIQDEQKLQVVAGSLRDAFGVIQITQRAGVIERDGTPQREFLRLLDMEATSTETEFATEDHDRRPQQGPEANTHTIEPTDVERPSQFSLAAASLRQAWQDLPDITFIADNLIVEETAEGLNIVIADQQGRPMFPEGSKYPLEHTRVAIAAIAPVLRQMPNQVRVTGHTAAGASYPDPRYGQWELSADRANVVRGILEEFGLPSGRVDSVIGRGDAEPFFPNDPYLSANQRVTILLMHEEPPLPPEMRP